MMWGHMAGGFWWGGMFLWWLVSLGVLFFVVYEAVYRAISRALREQQPSSVAPPPEHVPPAT